MQIVLVNLKIYLKKKIPKQSCFIRRFAKFVFLVLNWFSVRFASFSSYINKGIKSRSSNNTVIRNLSKNYVQISTLIIYETFLNDARCPDVLFEQV